MVPGNSSRKLNAAEIRQPVVGDVIFLKGWGGIIGEVKEVSMHGDELSLTLCWPNEHFWPSDFQAFYPVLEGEYDIVKTPAEAMEIMSELFEAWRQAAIGRHRQHVARGEEELFTKTYFFARNGL